jgi:hypothetical protein
VVVVVVVVGGGGSKHARFFLQEASIKNPMPFFLAVLYSIFCVRGEFKSAVFFSRVSHLILLGVSRRGEFTARSAIFFGKLHKKFFLVLSRFGLGCFSARGVEKRDEKQVPCQKVLQKKRQKLSAVFFPSIFVSHWFWRFSARGVQRRY